MFQWERRGLEEEEEEEDYLDSQKQTLECTVHYATVVTPLSQSLQ
jgi:hypothetical protein